ncbi:MAG: hypothetical protein IKL04_05140 [Lachnospiraceae bacterium]|nr:hypothetical protein [Lachnospiraceae bacterium]
MLEQDYKELMQEINADEVLVEKMVNQLRVRKKKMVFSGAKKVAAALLCGILVLGSSVVVADAATDGAVRRWFGLDDSVAVGAVDTSITRSNMTQEGDWSSIGFTKDENGQIHCEIISTMDVPVFTWYFETSQPSNIQFMNKFNDCDTEEEYAQSLYECLSRVFYEDYKIGTKYHEEFMAELEQCAVQLDTADVFQRGCEQGIRRFMEDLKSGHAGASD